MGTALIDVYDYVADRFHLRVDYNSTSDKAFEMRALRHFSERKNAAF